jgi:hypothetical protein
MQGRMERLDKARKRISMAKVYALLDPIYFWRSFQMSYASFVKLLGILAPAINQLSTQLEQPVHLAASAKQVDIRRAECLESSGIASNYLLSIYSKLFCGSA